MPREQVLLYPCFLRPISDISCLFTPKSKFWVAVGSRHGRRAAGTVTVPSTESTLDLRLVRT